MKYLITPILITILLCSFSLYAICQSVNTRENYTLKGRVLEKGSLNGIPYVTVRLFDTKSGYISAVSSNEKGAYTITTKKRGTYILKFFAMGFSEDSLFVNASTPGEVILEDIMLFPGQILNEIRIVAQKSLITQEADKLVYDVSLDPDAKKMKISEIMKKIPHMQQNMKDGKFSYLEDNITTIQINGKRNDLINGNRQYPMNFIKANVMSKIEVIMPNTAENKTDKYLINIKLAKDIPNGYASENLFRGSTLNRFSGSTDYASKIGKLYYSLNYALSYDDTPMLSTFTVKENYIQSQPFAQIDTTRIKSNNLQHNFTFGFGAELKNDHKIFINISAVKSTKEFNSQITSKRISSGETENEYSINSTSSMLKDRPRLNAVISYNGPRIVIDYVSNNSFSQNIRNLNNTITGECVSSNENTISGSTTTKLSNKLYLWYFGSYSNRLYSNLTDIGGFDYNSNIFNLLINLQKRGQRVSTNLNLNINNENIKGNFHNSGVDTKLDYTKFKILPELSISYISDKKYRYNLSYEIIITRPGLATLNPYIDKSDPENITQGNPDLKPELQHDFGINVRKQLKKLFLVGGLKFRHTKGAIERYFELLENGSSYTSFGNIGSRNVFALEISARYKFDFLSIGSNLTITKNYYKDSGKRLDNSLLLISNRTSLDFPITKSSSLIINYNLRTQAKSAQAKSIKYYSLFTIDFNQVLINNRLYCGLSINDPFKNKRFLNSSVGNDEYIINTNRQTFGRVITFNLRWNFGRFKEKPEGLGNMKKGPSDIYLP